MNQSQVSILDNSQSLLLSIDSVQNSEIDNFTVLCCQKNKALFTCINNQCHAQNPFVCNQQCKCQQTHQECQKGNIKFIIKKLNQKINRSALIKNQLQEIIDKLIDQLSLLKDKIIDSQIQSSILNTLESSFLKSLQTNVIQAQLIGNMQNLWKGIKTKQIDQKPTALDLLKNKITDLQKSLQIKIQSINTFMASQSIKAVQLQAYQLFRTSSIQELDIVENIQKLKAFFPKSLKKATLMYRASENNFSTKKFYEVAGLQTNMMIISKTKKGKVIGGYTPLVIKSPIDYDHYVEDPTFSTFIFSLTQNDKFKQKSKDNAIYRTSKQQRICFGGCEFEICDKANTVQKCRSYSLNYHFENENYQSNKASSFERFNGNQGQYFSVIEWQAWKIEFS